MPQSDLKIKKCILGKQHVHCLLQRYSLSTDTFMKKCKSVKTRTLFIALFLAPIAPIVHAGTGIIMYCIQTVHLHFLSEYNVPLFFPVVPS